MNIIVVDKQDKIIGAESMDVVDHKGLIYRVSALWVVNSKREVLLAQRAFDKTHDPGKWGPAVAGTVEEGESYEDNITKEAEEELGICNVRFKLEPKIWYEGKHKHFTQWFSCVIDKDTSDFKIQKEEVTQIRWFSKKELLEALDKHPKQFLTGMKSYAELFLEVG